MFFLQGSLMKRMSPCAMMNLSVGAMVVRAGLDLLYLC